MTDVLCYGTYMAQGGDWGGAISSWIDYEHAQSCRAIYVNIMTMRHPDGPQGHDEIEWASAFDRDQIMEDGYRPQQALSLLRKRDLLLLQSDRFRLADCDKFVSRHIH